MKKIQLLLIGLVSLMAAGTSSAAPVALGSGSNPVTMLQCTQLANDISLVLTRSVLGAIDCDDATIIGLSLCHETGLTISRTASEAPTAGANPGDPATCPAGMQMNDAETLCIGTVTGAAFPSATTAQGTVSSRYPGGDCDAANAATESTAAVADAPQ